MFNVTIDHIKKIVQDLEKEGVSLTVKELILILSIEETAFLRKMEVSDWFKTQHPASPANNLPPGHQEE